MSRFKLVHQRAREMRAKMAAKHEPPVVIEKPREVSLRDAVREYVHRPTSSSLMRVKEIVSR